MQIDLQEQAANSLMECVGKYITIYHKYNKNHEDNSHSQDLCVVKVLSVTKAQFLSLPRLKVQFNNGKTAEFDYSIGYGGQLMIRWDYRRTGRYFNDMFVCFEDGQWQYTYPSNKETMVDYFLTNGDLFVDIFESDMVSFATVEFYNETLEMAKNFRMNEEVLLAGA